MESEKLSATIGNTTMPGSWQTHQKDRSKKQIMSPAHIVDPKRAPPERATKVPPQNAAPTYPAGMTCLSVRVVMLLSLWLATHS